MSPRNLSALILAVLLAAGVGYTWFAARDTAATPVPKGGPVPVRVGKAATADVPLRLTLVGRGEAFESVSVRARVDGQVAEVAYAEGQRVKAGDVLVRLDTADLQARQRQAQANLARDEALLEKARNDVARYASLLERGFVADEKAAEVRTLAAAAEATVGADRAAADLARLQLGYATVRAPFAGVVGARLVHPGTAVKINDTPLVVINRIKPLKVSFTVPEKHLPAVRAALARGALEARVGVPGTGDGVPAQARFLDPTVDAATGTAQMKAELPNADERFLPGQFLEVALTLDTLRGAVTVPLDAVFQGAKGPAVFVVEAGDKAALRPVDVTVRQDGLAVIAKGVAAGEAVVTEGQLRLTPGAAVRVADASAAPPAAAKPTD